MKNLKDYFTGKALKLSIFDGNPNTNTTGSEGLSVEMKTYYSKYLITLAEPKLVHDQFAQQKNIPQGSGKTVEFRKYHPLAKALTPLVEGVTKDGNSLNATGVNVTVSQFGDYIVLSDLLEMTAIDDNVVQATKVLASQAGRTLDTITRDVINGTGSVYYAPITVSNVETEVTARHLLDATGKFTADCAFASAAQLKAVDAPDFDGAYVGIIHPYVSYDLMRSDEWIDVAKYSTPENYHKGETGKIGGVRFVETSEAKIFYAEDLCSASRTLTVASNASASATITVNETLTANELAGRYVLIGGTKYKVASNTAKVGDTKAILTLVDAEDGTTSASVTASANDKIYPGEAGAQGLAVFSTMILGQDAYATTSIEGGGLEHIVKPLGSSGVADALNQRASVGWKATKAAIRLVDPYMVRVESVSPKYSAKIKQAN